MSEKLSRRRQMKFKKIMSLVLGWILVLFAILSSGCAGSEYKFGKLTKLADKYEADKGSKRHYYTEVYEYFFWPMKNKARKICEIGIAQGASTNMFRDYFPDAVIYGIDILDRFWLNSNAIKTFVADQANRKQLKNFIDAYGDNFDIILDDGGHTMEQQQVSFGYLFKYLKPGGYYIIEDVHTSLEYHGGWGVEENEENTTLVMINNFIRNGSVKSKYMNTEEVDYLTANISYCNLLSRGGSSITCIFKKK